MGAYVEEPLFSLILLVDNESKELLILGIDVLFEETDVMFGSVFHHKFDWCIVKY